MSKALTPGTPEYVKGLAEVERLIEQAQAAISERTIEFGKLERARILVKERILWPSVENEKRGMYCSDCGLVVYSEQQVGKCPRCGSWGWYFVMPNWQPKVQYGMPERKVCKCGTIVYGDVEVCPICRNKL